MELWSWPTLNSYKLKPELDISKNLTRIAKLSSFLFKYIKFSKKKLQLVSLLKFLWPPPSSAQPLRFDEKCQQTGFASKQKQSERRPPVSNFGDCARLFHHWWKWLSHNWWHWHHHLCHRAHFLPLRGKNSGHLVGDKKFLVISIEAF